jgi:hypothetical protein
VRPQMAEGVCRSQRLASMPGMQCVAGLHDRHACSRSQRLASMLGLTLRTSAAICASVRAGARCSASCSTLSASTPARTASSLALAVMYFLAWSRMPWYARVVSGLSSSAHRAWAWGQGCTARWRVGGALVRLNTVPFRMTWWDPQQCSGDSRRGTRRHQLFGAMLNVCGK